MAEVLHALCSSKFLGYEIKERGVGGSCGTRVLKGGGYRGYVENQGKRLLGRPRFDWRLIFIWILKRCNGKLWDRIT